MRITGRNKEGGTGVVVDDALKQKAQKAFPEKGGAKGEDVRQKAEDQKSDAPILKEEAENRDEVEQAAEESTKKMNDVHQEPQKQEETDPDEVLKGWSVPQGDELRQADEVAMEQPDDTQGKEVPRAGQIPMEASTPLQD